MSAFENVTSTSYYKTKILNQCKFPLLKHTFPEKHSFSIRIQSASSIDKKFEPFSEHVIRENFIVLLKTPLSPTFCATGIVPDGPLGPNLSTS